MKKNAGRAGIAGVILLLIVVVAVALGLDPAELGLNLDPPQSVAQPGEPAGPGAQWYEIYFTDPTCPDESQRTGGLDEVVAADLLLARRQVDVAAYDLDAEPVVEALIELEGRGVFVRVVTDEDNADQSSIRRLRRNGISVVEDERSALMHNKFIIIDNRYLWVGSMNLTSNGAYCNNNNFVRLDAPQIAFNYRAEMEEMYDDRSFGPTSPDNALNKIVEIDGVRVENYFASEDHVAPIIGQKIATARDEVLFMAFSFTHEDIGEAMIDRAEAGIQVRGVFETVGSDTDFSYYPEMDGMRLPNLQVRQDGNNRLMHHKVIIIDGRTVIFGSFNFTGNANDSNDENVLIIEDTTFAGYFVAEFQGIWAEAGE
jgi:phosphatidylserine/phosphatidylglycerophosphate/cardiolipin synthase-like enzyme